VGGLSLLPVHQNRLQRFRALPLSNIYNLGSLNGKCSLREGKGKALMISAINKGECNYLTSIILLFYALGN